jgi:diketogulonate reductase-like aldo/keto reductase
VVEAPADEARAARSPRRSSAWSAPGEPRDALAATGSGPQGANVMVKRAVPSTREELPVIGMGTWRTFDPPDASPATLDRLWAVLKTFADAGGRVIDTSPMYGRSEDVTGMLAERLPEGTRSELFLATKVWTTGEAAGVRQMEESFRLLRRKRLDLMQVHNLVDWRTQLRTLRGWKAEGRIRYVGVTHYEASGFPALEEIVRREHVDFVQLAYSVGMRAAEERLLPLAADTGTAVLVNRPFEGGGLFERARGMPLPDFVRPFASSWAQAFLKFAIAHSAVTCVIPATSNPDHMRDNVQAGVGRLPDADERKMMARVLA